VTFTDWTIPPTRPVRLLAMDQHTISANGVEFAYFEDGPADGPLALCLHGFPDSAHTWRYLLPELAAAGFHAVAPFMRGYAPTQIPDDGHFQVGALVRDANALHDALGGGDDAVIIGHDWGAMATYGAVAHQPDRWHRVVTGAVPPTSAIGMSLFSYPQLHSSWYMFFFLSPLAEMALPMDNFAFIDGLWADWSPGYDGTWDVDMVKQSIGDPEHILAAISYYRALYVPEQQVPELAEEQAAFVAPTPKPTLYLHGRDDACMLLSSVSNPLDFLAPGSAFEIVDDAGHFFHLEQPASVNSTIVNFLTA
jgi:pimeloyl-ACP methyl ester carboxylesterase